MKREKKEAQQYSRKPPPYKFIKVWLCCPNSTVAVVTAPAIKAPLLLISRSTSLWGRSRCTPPTSPRSPSATASPQTRSRAASSRSV